MWRRCQLAVWERFSFCNYTNTVCKRLRGCTHENFTKSFLMFFLFPFFRFCKDVFEKDYKATIGVDFEIERFEISGAPFSLQMWVTGFMTRVAADMRVPCVFVFIFTSCFIAGTLLGRKNSSVLLQHTTEALMVGSCSNHYLKSDAWTDRSKWKLVWTNNVGPSPLIFSSHSHSVWHGRHKVSRTYTVSQ